MIVFNSLTLQQIFCITKTFFKKLEYHFLVESTNIKNASFPYKTAMSEANVKINRMGSTKGPIKKNGVLPVTTLLFWKFCFSLRTSYKELTWCNNYLNVNIHTLRERWGFIWGCLFPVSTLSNLFRFVKRTKKCNFADSNTIHSCNINLETFLK